MLGGFLDFGLYFCMYENLIGLWLGWIRVMEYEISLVF